MTEWIGDGCLTYAEQGASALVGLRCSYCGRSEEATELQTTCPACGKVLLATYDLERAAITLNRDSMLTRAWNLWRYAEIMPVLDPAHRLSLGEGGTPLLPARRYGAEIGLNHLLVKDEGRNPTGSFKARGLGAAVSKARELGAEAIALPSAGNAAAAAAAYAAAGGLRCVVFMPRDVPQVFAAECWAYGAQVFLVDGLINDAGAIVRELSAQFGWFDVSTLREPYRQEGKKTMGIELVEQLGWNVPDVIIYPTGGGTGIVGMWKAFDELEALGLIGPDRPRMVVVQSAGCAPIVRAYAAGERHASLWTNATTVAPGLRVPVAIGDYLILDALRASDGTALAIEDAELVGESHRIARSDGLFVSPEAGAALAAARRLRDSGWIHDTERVVVFATGSGLLHPDL
ncbi:MAG: threonine synthase, partial [Chloroflexi bacterium]